MIQFQALTYESLAWLGPVWSAVCAGFAVIVFDKVYLTASGERYLEVLETTHPQLTEGTTCCN
jgi:hypothetical protein